jgi:hypothetical protein
MNVTMNNKLAYALVIGILISLIGDTSAEQRPEFVDYCQRLEEEIQGRKQGFIAGNVTSYVGGFHASWKLQEEETICDDFGFAKVAIFNLTLCCNMFLWPIHQRILSALTIGRLIPIRIKRFTTLITIDRQLAI